MLQSIKQLYGNKLGASDGDIGHVKDFYFNDDTWAVRYVVADTGSWMSGQQVLISPHAFGSIYPAGKAMLVKLTRKQIEDSPSIETHKPVSRQYEEEYHRYYGWPFYWEGDGLWGGMRGFPILEVPPKFRETGSPAAIGPKTERADTHLRSTQAVTGYHLQATDGIIGHVCDFMMDDKSWAINQLVIKIGHRFTGKEVQIPMSQVDRISYKESTVFAKLSKDAVEKSPEHRLVPNESAIPAESIVAS
jgi:sporulation protein YlmC with PRC-barrel domain